MENFGCLGSTIKVHAGHYVDLLNPKSEDIDLESIAHALSNTCRYGGHSPRFYSVAEHSYHAARLALMDDPNNSELARSVLLHDAAEAYVGDMVKPLKVEMPDFCEAEGRFEAAISARFDVDLVTHHNKIKHYDRVMLKTEKLAMWPDDKVSWAVFDDVPESEILLRYWSPAFARQEFLCMAAGLCLR